MKIAHITECFDGGVSRAIRTAVRLTPEHEHHLLFSGSEIPDPADFASIERLPRGYGARVSASRRGVSRIRPDIVHAHSSWAGAYTRTLPISAPVVYEPHCFKFDDPTSRKVARLAFRSAEWAFARRTAAVAVLSPHEDRLVKGLRKSLRTVLIPNVPTISPKSVSSRNIGPRVVMIGRICKQKDPENFADVVRLLARDGVEFIWIGDGEPEGRVRLQDAGVHVTGWLDNDGLSEQLERPAVYYHSASYEGFPLSILDAAAFGHPIVARRIRALEGSPVRLASSPDEAAREIRRLLDGDRSAIDSAEDSRQELLRTMTEDRQRAALNELYGGVTIG